MTPTEGLGVEVLRERLERLEGRMRVVMTGWVLSVAVFVLLGVTAQQTASQPEVLRARRIEVVDAAGRQRIGLGVAADGISHLSLRDAGGQIRTMLGVAPDGSGSALGFHDAAGEIRAVLGIAPDGMTWLTLRDAAGQMRLRLAVFPDGSPRLTLHDAAERVLFRAP